jgi:hypothetical protein
LILYDAETIHELTTFIAKGSSYEAGKAHHDDLVMNLVMFGYFVQLGIFSEIYDINIKSLIYDEQQAEIERDMIPFGFIDDGQELDRSNDWNLL